MNDTARPVRTVLRHLRIAVPALMALLFLLIPFTLPAQSEVTCSICREEITGEYVETPDGTFHARHFRCDWCRKPIDELYITSEEKHYHKTCYDGNVALRCNICDGLIQGRYNVDHWGNRYHLSHEMEFQRCEYCARPIADMVTGGGIRYGDGRHVCNMCVGSAIRTERMAAELMEEAAWKLKRLGMEVEPEGIRIRVIGLKEMQSLVGDGSHSLRGFTRYEERQGLFSVSKTLEIDLLYGLPYEDAMATLAHELAHAWQFLNGKKSIHPAFSEGSANYAAYLILTDMGDERSAFVVEGMMQDKDRNYGEGFRRVKQYAEEVGTRDWLNRLRTQTHLPSGY